MLTHQLAPALPLRSTRSISIIRPISDSQPEQVVALADSPTTGNFERLANRSSFGSSTSIGGSSYSGETNLSFQSGEVLKLCSPPASRRNSRQSQMSQCSSTFSSARPISTSKPFGNRHFSASSQELVNPGHAQRVSLTAAEAYL